MNSFDFARPFTHLFEDPNWARKTAVGALLSLVPILNLAVLGYEVRIIRNVNRGTERPLPDWDALDAYFVDGLKLAIARIVLSLPALVLFLLGLASALAASTGAQQDAPARAMWGVAGAIAGFGLGILFALGVSLLMFAVTVNYARRGALSACFDLREPFRLVLNNPVPYVLAWLTVLLAGWAYGALASLLLMIPCVGWVLLIPAGAAGSFWIATVTGHALGQVAAIDDARRGAAPMVPQAV